MLDLKPVAISPRLRAIIPQPPLKLIPLTKPKLICSKPQRHRHRQPIFPNLAPAKWLHADVQIIWRHTEILSRTESESNANTLVDRPANITPQTQRPQNIEIKILRDWNCELNVGPELIVALNSLRGGEAAQRTKQETNVEDSFQLFDGRTVNDVSATTTRSPTCNRVALASGLGRVAIIDLVDRFSGVSVVR